jgi:hypothetical protein
MKFLKLFFFLGSISALAQTDLGIGTISINFTDKTVLSLYQKPSDKKAAHILKFFDDETINSTNIKNLEKEKVWLKPEVLWLDYHYFILRCKSQTKDAFEVIINNETGETLWLKKSKWTTFKTWENYLKGMFMIKRVPTSISNDIRRKPEDNAEENIFTGEECFQVKSMKGNWIEIFTGESCEEDGSILDYGWIKWRDGNNLLIEYFLTS